MSELISAVDSYYSFVKAQMLRLGAQVSINGSLVAQPFGPIIDSRDWPLTPPIEGALYLLLLNIAPTRGGTAAQTKYQYFLQWVWLLIGTDIGGSQVAQNRGDRYRSNMQIQENLNQANYPGFCQRFDYTADVNGVLSTTPSQSQYPFSEIEMVTWSEPRFMPKSDNNQSGLVYGAAAVELLAYSDVASVLA